MPASGSRLVERSRELDRIRGHLDAAARGEGSVCLIQGAAGVGKTALLAAARSQAVAAGLTVLTAVAGLLEADLAWDLVRQLFVGVIAAVDVDRDDLLEGAAALAAAPLGLVDHPQRGASGLHGLYWLTARLAQRLPLMIAVDDAHWGDEPSLRYLAYLAARVADLPVALVMTMRSGEPEREPLQASAALPAANVIVLGELSPAGSAELTRSDLGGGAAEEFCAACHEATNGNPFLIRELVTELRREGLEPSAERAADVRGVNPQTVNRAVLLRLTRLPEAARELARAVAVLGGDVRLADAAALAGLDGDEAARAADALAGAAILAPDSLSFVHPLVRDAVYRDLPPYDRSRRHRRAADVLARAGAGAERVAAQLLEAEPAGDAWVVDRLREAAAAAFEAGAPSSAADLLARALGEPAPEEARPQILAELGRAEAGAGRSDAAHHMRQAVELAADPVRRATLLLDLGRLLYVTGKAREAAEAFEAGQRELTAGSADHPSLRAGLQAAWLAAARLEVPLRPRAVEIMHEIAADPPRGGTLGERALLAQVAGQLTFESAPRDSAIALARLALGDGELIREETSEGMSWVVAASALGRNGDFDGYAATLDLALEDARRRGLAGGFATASYAYGYVRYLRGELTRAIADTQQAIDAESQGWRQFLIAARAQLAVALLERGELDAAAAALAPAGTEGSSMHSFVFEAYALIHLARGAYREALEAALAAGRIADRALVSNPAYMPWRSRAAVAAARLGDMERAEAWIDEELALARHVGTPHVIATTLMAAGAVRGRAGIGALEEAVELLADSPARLEHARALVHLGAALRRFRSRKAAREVLQRGLDICAATGAAALEDRARTELAATGARPRRRRITGAESLTPAELRVAELAAGGMSNREIAESLFVSLRTVETHLTHVYRKLDIESRSGLATSLSDADRGSSG